MKEHKIIFILIQIDEAHSSEWPIGLEDQPEPHKNIQERLDKASQFMKEDNPPSIAFSLYVDTWNNDFAETYHAWPDKYYCVDKNNIILNTSTYGSRKDALIDVDCIDVIKELIN